MYEGHGGYGIVADIGTKNADEPCIILRAGKCEDLCAERSERPILIYQQDMDALPILEAVKGIDEFKSMKDGRMHACKCPQISMPLLQIAALTRLLH